MDVKNKPTTLDDNAGIYQKRVVKSEKQKFSELHGKDKWYYYKDYYLKITIAIILIISLSIYFIYSIWQSKKQTNIFFASVINYYFPEEVISQLEESFSEYIGKSSKYENVTFDNTFNLSFNDYSTYQNLQMHIMVGDIDVFIAPENYFNDYIKIGAMASLTDCLPTDLYNRLSDKFIYGNISDSENDTLSPTGVYGIYIDETPLFSLTEINDLKPVLGIIINSKNMDNAIDFIHFIFNEFVPDYEFLR